MQRAQRFPGRLLLLGLVVGAGQGFADGPPKPKPQPEVEFAGRRTRQGVVAEVTKDSVTVAFPELPYQVSTVGPDGKTQWIDKVAPAEPNKKFPVSETLAAGKTPKEQRPWSPLPHQPDWRYSLSHADMYRLSDVKVGDWVGIIYARVGGVDVCDHIRIDKRPGGRVPPLPEDAEALGKPKPIPGWPDPPYTPYHEWMNAYWDLEDKGIPFPEKFGEDRRFPVAPPPREVKVGPAIAP